jgi:hypothetical protein
LTRGTVVSPWALRAEKVDAHPVDHGDQAAGIVARDLAPFYVALARGTFAAQGVEIEFVSSPRPRQNGCRLWHEGSLL